MPDVFRLLFKYFWVVMLALMTFNYFKTIRALGAKSEGVGRLSDSSKAYVARFAIAASLPWVVMGAGQVLGSTPSVWYYFRPQDGNPFVLAWFALIFSLWCIYAWWIFFAEGAAKVREMHLMALFGVPSRTMQSERTIKLFALIGPLMFPILIYTMVSMNAQVPK